MKELFQKVLFFVGSINRKYISLFIILAITIAAFLTFIQVQQNQDIRQRASYISPTPINYATLSFLKLFGQRNFTETSINKVNARGIYHASGVHVDRSSNPNKVYVVDTGNNRILGYNGAGTCSHNTSISCTIDADCGSGNSCVVDGTKDADIVFGQSDFEGSACNRDDNNGMFTAPTAETLCFTGKPLPTNIAEMWTRTNIDTDSQGNLYITDKMNDRILKFNQPFSSDRTGGKGDTIADFVLGQENFTSHSINGLPFTNVRTPIGNPSNRSLWVGYGRAEGATSYGGVSVDGSGNVWVADTFNHRILRFPPDSNEANLVLGQSTFTTKDRSNTCYLDSPTLNGRYKDPTQHPLDKLCHPTLAKVDPNSGNLYVIDEYWTPFYARILVYNSPFTNGMAAARVIVPRSTLPVSGYHSTDPYYLQATGFAFNPYTTGAYASGKLWINEHQTFRTILIDDDGTIVKIIGAPDDSRAGGDRNYGGACGSIYDGYNVWWPGGSIGFDSANNMYLADERFHRIARYALPYDTRVLSGQTCLPAPNGGLFPGADPNVRSDDRLGEAVGMTVFQNQLLVFDQGRRLKAWNDFRNKPAGAPPDYIITTNMPSGGWFGDAIDDANRLWLFGEHGDLRVYQLPFTSSNPTPLKTDVTILWSDDNSRVSTRMTGITFDKRNRAIYIADVGNHRVLRIRDYNNFATNVHVDLVIGQPDKSHVRCNFTQDMPWLAAGPPTASSLCNPQSVKFDKLGNLYVVENAYETHGNNRITVFMESDLQNATTLFPLIEARKVFNAPTFTTFAGDISKSNDTVNKPGSPISVAFTSNNKLIIGNDGYYGDDQIRHIRQLWFYNDPLTKQTPDGVINLPIGAPGEMVIDDQDYLFIQDHTWPRVWVVHPGIDTSLLDSLPGFTAVWPAPAAAITSTLTHSPTPIPPTTTDVPPTPTQIPAPTADPTATSTPTCDILPITQGNANNDCFIDGIDFNVWREEFLGIRTTRDADFNGDGVTNGRDFNIWRDGFLSAQM